MKTYNLIRKALLGALCAIACNAEADTTGGTYQVITSTDDFATGDVIVLVSYDESKNMFAMGTYNDANAFHAINIGTTTADYLPETVTINEVNSDGKAYEYKVTKSGDDITLKNEDNHYISGSKNNTPLTLSTSPCNWTPYIYENNPNYPYEAVCLHLKSDVRYITYSPTYKFRDYSTAPSSSEYIMRAYCYKKITTGFSITFNETGYATMYYAYNDVELAKGMRAFTLSLVEDGGTYKLRFNEIGNTVPHGTAVMIKGTPNTEYHPLLYSTAATTANNLSPLNDGNALHGTETDMTQTDGEGQYYKLANDDTRGLGFYWGAADGAAFTNMAHKAYIYIPASSSASLCPDLSFIDEVSAIGSISEKTDADREQKRYDITGRVLNASASNAITIINKKKIIRQ